MLPSILVMVRLAKNNPKNQSRMPDPTNVKRSKLLMPANCKGVMEARAPQHKEDIEQIAAYDVADGYFGILFQGSHNGGSQFGQGSASGYECESDNGFADTQITGDVTCSFYKPLSSEDKSA